jgi:RNA polymerase sigma factor (sigma-70 family)
MSQTIQKRYKRVAFSEQELIEGLRQNEDWAVREIYVTQFKAIKKMVYTFKNISLEPDDIFQEGLTRAILNIQAGKFKNNSAFNTYLNGICKNICRKQLEKQNMLPIANEPESTESINENYYEMLSFVNQLKAQLNLLCREIIDLRFKQNSEQPTEKNKGNKLPGFEEIARKLDITSDTARQRLKRCLDQLRKMIFEHPEYQTLFD